MKAVAMLNGQFVDIDQPLIHIEDRGYQFGDGVYEVVPIMEGRLVGFDYHMERLTRSLREIKIPAVYTHEELLEFHVEMMKEGNIYNGNIYMQITRGTCPRNHQFPDQVIPVMTMVGRAKDYDTIRKHQEEGVKLLSTPDIRWHRCDIKTLNLLGNVLCKQKAIDAGFYDALLYRENGNVTEGSSSNFSVIKDGVIWTHPDGDLILPGCTKRIILKDLCPKLDIPVVEKAFSMEFAKAADEAFLSASSYCPMPVVKIDKNVIKDGKPGPLTNKIKEAFDKYVQNLKPVLEKS